ncbi:MAG: ORF6N domain-containing protein [Deltaproteobacteria bacterium]|nr:ORF6N domain-containing protein [Deltaproteobacteria bacterium]
MKKADVAVPAERIEQAILFIRGQKVLIDRDLSQLYQVSTKVLNQAVKRNKKRFPEDFMFRFTKEERQELVTICDRFAPLKHSSTEPYAFTEQSVGCALRTECVN